MIDAALEYIRRELIRHLGVAAGDVILGNIHALKEDNSPGLYVSLVNIEEENTLRNQPYAIKQNNGFEYRQPPIHLNLYLVLAANFGDYPTGLLHLSNAIELFQSKPLFNAATQHATNPFPNTLEKLTFDFCNLNFEQLNHLWGMLGGQYLASAVYKMRIVRIQADDSIAGPEITTIRVEIEQK